MLYLDANASSRLRPSALRVLQAAGSGALTVANPSSIHSAGRASRALLRESRDAIAKLLKLTDQHRYEVVFTSGGTEACNLMVSGFIAGASAGEALSSAIEHPAVLEPLRSFQLHGGKLKLIPPLSSGVVSVSSFVEALSAETCLVTLMGANNETGALQPIAELAKALRSNGYRGPIVSDLTQALGKSELELGLLFDQGIDAVAVSGHKVGAPTGIGVLVLNLSKHQGSCRLFSPLQLGGTQESGFRAGTENVVGAMAFGAVASELAEGLSNEVSRLRQLREMLWRGLSEVAAKAQRLTPFEKSGEILALSNTLLVCFPGVSAESLVTALDLAGVCVSAGAACASGKQQPSHVVLAMGYPETSARETVRFSLDWDASDQTVGETVSAVATCLVRMDAASSRIGHVSQLDIDQRVEGLAQP